MSRFRSYYQEHKEEILRKRKERYYAHRDEMCARSRNYQHSHPDVRRKRELRRRFGLSLEEYSAMLSRQGGVCAICGGPPDGMGKKKTHLHVDHDHVSGKIRGLLCGYCNVMLGHAKDSVSTLQSAISYLDKSKG